MRVLLVEDEKEFAGALKAALSHHRMIADHARDLAEAALILNDAVYDVVVLDRKLPDGDGLSLIPVIRARGNTVPVLMLTALDDLADRVAGLDGGADDYIGKPFAFEELLARLRALARRPVPVQSDVVTVGRLSFDLAHCEASVAGTPLKMPRRELLVLETLTRRMGRMVLRAALMEAVFGLDDEIQSNALDTHISRVRRKLADADAGVTINGIRGVGYLLREDQ
ncbi:response regulator transcription factor [Ensifer sp. YR511]|uniref:response regulator transcription factor n=1 Tax=Ensifer sp. YR511 TaxID=1855294 RepID=UPI00088A28A8|nr:response regulator transcription factor [Ensifer sp. YR511]SDM32500.1 DNA-binding response regulator, OmpR family, contains REC and winged-helix (wHTH) domain [Ensifer sp. YR511]